jgi:hypothetical protein
MKRLIQITALCATLALSGCYVVETAPGTYSTVTPASYDRSFAAASGALRDQGLAITVEDPAAGTIIGTLSGATVTASIRRQADGSVRVQFDGRDVKDPGLMNRVSQSYDRRMGR